jgi:O-antigen ligase
VRLLAQRVGLVLLLVGSLAAVGGSYRWSTFPLLLAALAVGALRWRRILRRSSHSLMLDAALLAILGVLALQLFPLPALLVDAVSPHSQRLRSLVRLDAPNASFHSLTIDQQATMHALATFSGVLIVFLIARSQFAQGGVRSLCRAIAAIGAILAVEGLIQRAATPQLVFGFWQPPDPSALPFGPFVNRNHFAAWLLLALPLTAGYLVAHARIHLPIGTASQLSARQVAHSNVPVLSAALGVMLVALLATLSRSALLGLCVSAALGWWMARRRLAGNVRWWLLVGGAVGLLITLAFVDVDGWAARLSGTFSSRVVDRSTIWRETLPLVRDFWLAGTGAGTYGMAMIVYQQSWMALPHLGSWAHFNQAHSHYLQVVAEGGILLTVPVAIALAAVTVAARRRLSADRTEMVWIRIGAVASLAGIAAQSIWETALRMPATAYLAAVVAAIALYERRDSV